MANRNSQSGFKMKDLIGGIIAATVLVWAMELCAGGQRDAAPSKTHDVAGAASGTNREPLPRALQVEKPITSGTPFSWDDADKVQDGMTEAEVVAILGQPYSRRESGDSAILVWSYTSSVGGSNAVACRFQNGRVVGKYRVSR